MDQIAGTYSWNDNAQWKLNQKIKDTLDPKGIIAPVRLAIAALHSRTDIEIRARTACGLRITTLLGGKCQSEEGKKIKSDELRANRTASLGHRRGMILPLDSAMMARFSMPCIQNALMTQNPSKHCLERVMSCRCGLGLSVETFASWFCSLLPTVCRRVMRVASGRPQHRYLMRTPFGTQLQIPLLIVEVLARAKI